MARFARPWLALLVITAACAQAPRPASTATPGPSPTHTPAVNIWQTYTAAEHGLTFEYPVICGELRVEGELISFAGFFTTLTIAPANGQGVAMARQALLEDLRARTGPYAPGVVYANSDHDPPILAYSALIAHHQFLAAVFVHQDALFTFSHRLSLACHRPEQGLTSPDWFYQTLESVRFSD